MSNTNNPLITTLQQGFRITVGATATLVETLQDPQKRQITFQDLQQQWGEKAEQWAEKGTVTEAEARQYVDQWLAQMRQKSPVGNPNGGAQTIDFATAQAELERLTQEIITLKEDLAKNKTGSGV
jgi:polyhydroxyalkanoate synthesis regulator phasin